ncbi:MAG: sugar phosphorylase [Candidatus Cyclonatronum sp.]|uniref:sugar phosphorylase n=1 Tax=Cyclonatronum sp. TaxID=3024185 RepID=UPI0025BEFB22|nr:sugar phosphorylase [Cyclonatronum sp.]MCC5934752.1 sugar phosphorylase [Balneolales bacterium]MCH8487402.1 sugar phosphorylase [Cyclonatronum sp.]
MILTEDQRQILNKHLSFIYPDSDTKQLTEKLLRLMESYAGLQSSNGSLRKKYYSHKDLFVIAYGDSIKNDHQYPLEVLHAFMNEHFSDLIKNLHILPFFPYSSDDGFSVIDYRKIRDDLGNWNHVTALSKDYRIMADLVINHVSSQSEYFREFLLGEGLGSGFFHVVNPSENVRMVTRPRSTPLFTPVATKMGIHHIWTTFSADQVDVNFGNPDVLFEFLDILLFYLEKGVRVIRLDAVAFLWKKIGTSCIHLPETHEVVKLIRSIVDILAPDTILITETNVPHKENVSYFGDGDEAHMVYNFSLPPLLYHAIITQNAAYLSEWSKNLSTPPEGCTYFNFAASHDGIGVRPLEGLVPDEEFNKIINAAIKRGGYVSYKENGDGTKSPYELNITYFDAFKDIKTNDISVQVRKFMCSQMLMLSFRGVPAIYIHSLFGTQNDYENVAKTGMARSINRRKWQLNDLNERLQDPENHHVSVFNSWKKLLRIRIQEAAFDPQGGKKVLDSPPELFVMWRNAPQNSEQIIVLGNVTEKEISWNVPDDYDITNGIDLISGEAVRSTKVQLEPWQVRWIKF